jgi:hypothetical protein
VRAASEPHVADVGADERDHSGAEAQLLMAAFFPASYVVTVTADLMSPTTTQRACLKAAVMCTSCIKGVAHTDRKAVGH